MQHQGIPSDWDHCLRSGTPLQDSSEKHHKIRFPETAETLKAAWLRG